MSRKAISENVERRLYAESMGRCMNPDCQTELFAEDGDIMERAHIDPYCKTADNSFENLVILCPNCHTNFDKNHAFSPEQVLSWKQIRRDEIDRLFSTKYTSFDELKEIVAPILLENKTIYENYYLGDNKKLWDKFEIKLLINNRKLKTILQSNFHLIQRNTNKDYSNLECIHQFLLHIEEFELTRGDKEKVRQVLFPPEINSMFGVSAVRGFLLPSTEKLEELITDLYDEGKYIGIELGIDNPYLILDENGKQEFVLLFDTPRLRQIYYSYGCHNRATVRLESLNYALKCIRQRGLDYRYICYNNLREILVKKVRIIFVYEYCLSEVCLMSLSPEEGSVIVNLHNWNEDSCISQQAYNLAEEMNITLLTMKKFYRYLSNLSHE